MIQLVKTELWPAKIKVHILLAILIFAAPTTAQSCSKEGDLCTRDGYEESGRPQRCCITVASYLGCCSGSEVACAGKQNGQECLDWEAIGEDGWVQFTGGTCVPNSYSIEKYASCSSENCQEFWGSRGILDCDGYNDNSIRKISLATILASFGFITVVIIALCNFKSYYVDSPTRQWRRLLDNLPVIHGENVGGDFADKPTIVIGSVVRCMEQTQQCGPVSNQQCVWFRASFQRIYYDDGERYQNICEEQVGCDFNVHSITVRASTTALMCNHAGIVHTSTSFDGVNNSQALQLLERKQMSAVTYQNDRHQLVEHALREGLEVAAVGILKREREGYVLWPLDLQVCRAYSVERGWGWIQRQAINVLPRDHVVYIRDCPLPLRGAAGARQPH